MADYPFHNPDLHIHSTYSDGTDTPAALLAKVRQANVDFFSLTDHDCMDGCREIAAALKPNDPLFVCGVELSCEDACGKYHILGYGYDPEKPALRQTVAMTHAVRRRKTENRLDYLENLGYRFTAEEKKYLLAASNPGKPHFARLLLDNGYASDKTGAFAIVSGYHGREERLSPEAAIAAITQSGGIPVLAHGILADGSKNLSFEEIRSRVSRLQAFGLMGLECFYSGYTPDQREIMLALARNFSLLVTAGSDYHGDNKSVRLGQTNTADFTPMMGFYSALQPLLPSVSGRIH